MLKLKEKSGLIDLKEWDRMRQETKQILAKHRKKGTVIPVDFTSGKLMKAELNNYIKRVAQALGENYE